MSKSAKKNVVKTFAELEKNLPAKDRQKYSCTELPEFKKFDVACVADVNGEPTVIVGKYINWNEYMGQRFAQFTRREYDKMNADLKEIGGSLIEIVPCKRGILIYTYPKKQKTLLARFGIYPES